MDGKGRARSQRYNVIVVIALAVIMMMPAAIVGKFTPDDPEFNGGGTQYDQWGLKDGSYFDYAWDLTDEDEFTNTGSNQIVVAIIDTAVDFDQTDLTPNLWVNSQEIPDNDEDDDENGYVDDVNGWDFWNDDGDYDDWPTCEDPIINEDPVNTINDDGDSWVDYDSNGYEPWGPDIIIIDDGDTADEFDSSDTILRANQGLFPGMPGYDPDYYEDAYGFACNDLIDEDDVIIDGDSPTSGTRIAGVVAEVTDNDLECAGAAQVSLMILRAVDNSCNHDFSEGWEGLNLAVKYAWKNGADVICLGIMADPTWLEFLEEEDLISSTTPMQFELENAWYSGITIFAPSGDTYPGRSRPYGADEVTYPAVEDTVIAVGGSEDSDDTGLWHSPFYRDVEGGPPIRQSPPGPEMELIANMHEVPVLDFDCDNEIQDTDCYLASALAAGAGALVLSYRPSWTNSQVRALLHATASPLKSTDYEWASGLDPGTGAGLCRAYGEVNAFDALRMANYIHDEWNEMKEVDDDTNLQDGVYEEIMPAIAVDSYGNTHIAWFQKDVQLEASPRYVMYNVITARGEKLFANDINIEDGHAYHGNEYDFWTSEWVDIEVDIDDNVYIIWNEPAFDEIIYTKLHNGNTLVAPRIVFSPQQDQETVRYLNLMHSEHPLGQTYVVFNLVDDFRHQIWYLKINQAGVTQTSMKIFPNNQEDDWFNWQVNADIGRVDTEEPEGPDADWIFYVWVDARSENDPQIPDSDDVYWNAFSTATQASQYGNGFLLRPPIDIGEQKRYDDEASPDIDVDYLTGESYVVWERRYQDPELGYKGILEYTWIDHLGVDCTGWAQDLDVTYGDPDPVPFKYRTSQVGKTPDHEGSVNVKHFPSIAYHGQVSQWDTRSSEGDERGFSTIVWTEPPSGSGLCTYYTNILPNGREILPDDDPTDQKLEGEAILAGSTAYAPAVDSGLESESPVIDRTDDVKVAFYKIAGTNWDKLFLMTTSETWNENNLLMNECEHPDIAVDPDDNYFVVWEYDDEGTTEIAFGIWNTIDTFIHGPIPVSTRDDTPSHTPKIVFTKDGENEMIHIFWIEDKVLDEIYYHKFLTDGGAQIGPSRAGFYPANRPGVDGFSILSLELGYDEEGYDETTEEQRIHVVYTATIHVNFAISKDIFQGSIDLFNVQYHAEASIGVLLMGISDLTGAIEIGTDSTPFVVYSDSGNIYFQVLNRDNAGARKVGGRVRIDDTGGYDRVSLLPNLMVDRDTIRDSDSKIDWDTSTKNDRFIHVVFYTKVPVGEDWAFELHYTKIDKAGSVLVPQKPVISEGGYEMYTIYMDFPDMVIDSDNRVGVVASGMIPEADWATGAPNIVIYYLKLDNNGEILTGPQMMSVLSAVQEGEITSTLCRYPAIDINIDNEVHMVMNEFDDPDWDVIHTRFWLL